MARLLVLLALLSANVLANSYRNETIDGVRYGVFTAEPADVSLHWQNSNGKAYRSLRELYQALDEDGRSIDLLMNAAIFSADETPAGLWIEEGKTLSQINTNRGQGNFHIQPNGVFWLADDQAHINTLAAYQRLKPQAEFAVQAGPMLLIDGAINSRFIKGLSSPYKRNAVCTTRSGDLYFIMTERYEDEWPSFYRLADALKQLGCYQALYLDGAISDWYIPEVSGLFHWQDFVGMIAVSHSSP
ncbi:phosphodiester glycosidase family protein [Suttonella sp. R2A3]|uniref:phosphodiester glycosidase family protein n=1 Tax=Suttonella sp. R2A3 TaxID=2908648 RepID=UPI001F45B68F|nr:phosphodiester glycosidase family protein [Suttonella sp. R2A3]UJF23829.1 phosphodiester glycosidase family protein [Suttonella sp. R2A3]